ncbi:ABC transporter permease subunit [Nocardia sp. NPDC050710]|uniref:ABC transporter permease n=1 Tax=Nocardia sp. NPDC050710 TaxID=3157220 RepID=UPI003405DBA6
MSNRFGSMLLAAVVIGVFIVAVAGPAIAPHSPTAPVGVPYALPGEFPPFGTDHLGRDVLSRVLAGARPVFITSALAAVVGTGLGAVIGLGAAVLGARKRWQEGALLRPLDAIAALPPLLVLLLIQTAQPSRFGIIVAVAVAGAPLSARVIRAAAAPLVTRGHVETAVARGENMSWILGRELLPLVAGPVAADLGLRFVMAVYLVTAAGFLGVSAGETDWGILIAEALPGAALQPAALAVPVALVAVVAVSVNLLADRALAKSRALIA